MWLIQELAWSKHAFKIEQNQKKRIRVVVGGSAGVGKIPLSEWSRWLFEEVFRDETGEGRPITTLIIDDELFGRAVRRGGAEKEPAEARQAFLESFPSRDTIAGWLGGTRDPGPATVSLLFLCCFAASEAGGSDQNDYRNRLQEILGWDAPIIGCAGLPALWNRLARQVNARASEGHYRSIVLPDPKHRNQIGHAIELTFPSRPDTAKLRTALGHGGLDELSKPASVLRWLAPLIAKGRFSKSFSDTFSSFENAWRSGQRALSDHRFWTGWTMVVAKQQSETEVYCPFEILSDEWGQYHLVDKNGAALELGTIVGTGSLPAVLGSAVRDRRPIFLIEEGWGRYLWAGPKKAGAGLHALAALIYER